MSTGKLQINVFEETFGKPIKNAKVQISESKSPENILEEVIYSISLSIRDNYDVNEVVFTVDGKEITKSVIKNIE